MVSILDADYYGLKVSAKPIPKQNAESTEEYLFLTGPSNSIEVNVLNKSERAIEGKIAVRVLYIISGLSEPSSFEKVCSFDLKPTQTATFTIWVNHAVEGQVIVCMCKLGQPENFRHTSEDEMMKKADNAASGEALCSYKVIDGTTHNIETKRFKLLQDQIKSLEASIKTQIDQAIKARLSEMGLVPNKSLKSEVVEERAVSKEQKTPINSSYIM